MNPYADLLAWVLQEYHGIVTKVAPAIDNAEIRTQWAKEADERLTALHVKYGK